MTKSVFSDAHDTLVEVLVAVRKDSGLLQEQVVSKLGKNQSYLSNIERGQRRVDVIEFCDLCRVMGADPKVVFTRFLKAAFRSR
jgi:transcriptional regulator with XRE-family HTH domain